MGLFTKIKDILFEEEEIVENKNIEDTKEIPKNDSNNIKVELREEKSATQEVVLPSEKKEITKEKSESKMDKREVFKSEQTFPFPLAFDESQPELRTRSSRNANALDLELKKKKERPINFRKVEEEAEVKPIIQESLPFRPSPIISPVYGILDKNYKKEDVKSKKEEVEVKPNLEQVRRKAYGSLEEEIENTLDKAKKDFYDDVPSKSIDDLLLDTISIDLDEEVEIEEAPEVPKRQSQKIEEPSIEIEEDENDDEDEEVIENTGPIVPNEKNDMDLTLENDLFNLIDSMYERKEDID